MWIFACQMADPAAMLAQPHVFFTTRAVDLGKRHFTDKRISVGSDAQPCVPPKTLRLPDSVGCVFGCIGCGVFYGS